MARGKMRQAILDRDRATEMIVTYQNRLRKYRRRLKEWEQEYRDCLARIGDLATRKVVPAVNDFARSLKERRNR